MILFEKYGVFDYRKPGMHKVLSKGIYPMMIVHYIYICAPASGEMELWCHVISAALWSLAFNASGALVPAT